MMKLGFTIAAAAVVLTAFVAPVNAGCRTITKTVETAERTVTQKTKVCDNSEGKNTPKVIVVPLVQRVPVFVRPEPRPLILVR
jgi:hypothetical protein